MNVSKAHSRKRGKSIISHEHCSLIAVLSNQPVVNEVWNSNFNFITFRVGFNTVNDICTEFVVASDDVFSDHAVYVEQYADEVTYLENNNHKLEGFKQVRDYNNCHYLVLVQINVIG